MKQELSALKKLDAANISTDKENFKENSNHVLSTPRKERKIFNEIKKDGAEVVDKEDSFENLFNSLRSDRNIKRKLQQDIACVEIVRKKSDREVLPAHTCTECQQFYDAIDKTHFTDTQKQQLISQCSRHRYRFKEPRTPEHFWSLPSL